MKKLFDLIINIEDTGKLADILPNCHPEFISGSQKIPKQVRNDVAHSGEYLNLLPKYSSSFRAFVPIMTGCNNFCSYCAVPYTRGREKSRPEAEIIKEIKGLIKNGYKEITLLGQNVNSYQGDALAGSVPFKGRTLKRKSFTNLIKNIDSISGDYRVYFYSNHPKDISDDLINILPRLKHFPHYLHLPLQSGNDRILQSMNRHYTKEKYLKLVQKIRKAVPDVVLTTDIIVGYPGEGEKEFADTIDVIKKSKFEMIFIGQYSPRSGTKSAKLPDEISKEEKKRRDKVITALLAENLEKVNKDFIGKTTRVLIDEEKPSASSPRSRESTRFYGRTEGYKVVEIKTDQSLQIGRFYDVEINKSSAWKLFGIT